MKKLVSLLSALFFVVTLTFAQNVQTTQSTQAKDTKAKATTCCPSTQAKSTEAKKDCTTTCDQAKTCNKATTTAAKPVPAPKK